METKSENAHKLSLVMQAKRILSEIRSQLRKEPSPALLKRLSELRRDVEQLLQAAAIEYSWDTVDSDVQRAIRDLSPSKGLEI